MKTISAIALAACLFAGGPAFAHMSGHMWTNQSMTTNNNSERHGSNANTNTTTQMTWKDRGVSTGKSWDGERHRLRLTYLENRVQHLIRLRTRLQMEVEKLMAWGQTGPKTMLLQKEIVALQSEIFKLAIVIHPTDS